MKKKEKKRNRNTYASPAAAGAAPLSAGARACESPAITGATAAVGVAALPAPVQAEHGLNLLVRLPLPPHIAWPGCPAAARARKNCIAPFHEQPTLRLQGARQSFRVLARVATAVHSNLQRVAYVVQEHAFAKAIVVPRSTIDLHSVKVKH
jgi:hypothetical protein